MTNRPAGRKQIAAIFATMPRRFTRQVLYGYLLHSSAGWWVAPPPSFTKQRKRRKSLWIILNNYFDFSDISVGLFRGSSVVLMLSWFISLALAVELIFMSFSDRLSKPSMLVSVFKKCDSVANIFVPFSTSHNWNLFLTTFHQNQSYSLCAHPAFRLERS